MRGKQNLLFFLGWINTYHPQCEKNPAAHISVEDLLAAFSKRLTYYRKAESAKEPAHWDNGASTSQKRDSPSPTWDDDENGDL